MSNFCFDKCSCVLFILCCFLNAKIYAQPSSSITDEWRQQLASAKDKENNSYQQISETLNKKDSAFVFSVLHTLEKSRSSNHYFNARLLCLKADQTARFLYDNSKPLIQQYLDKALNETYRSSDDYLISFVCQMYGRIMSQELEISTTYYLKSAEIEERLNRRVTSPYFSWFGLGIALFYTREFEKSIYYIQKGLGRWADTSRLADLFRISYLNAIGQDYQHLGKYDSALLAYQKSIDIARKRNVEIWVSIDCDFIGQAYFQLQEYKKAKPLLMYAYNSAKEFDFNIAANSLQWLSRIYLVEVKKDSALLRLREAFQLLARSTSFPLQNREYTQYAYLTMAETYKALGNTDSFYHYFQLYSSLHDSLERVAALSSLKIAQLRVANERNYQTIQSLEKEKKDAVIIRNLFITAVILLSIIALMYTNRQKLRYRYREQIAVKEKEAAQMEIISAKEQLDLITESIIEKTTLVEKLEQQVQEQQLNADQYRMIDELSNLTILTEDEWSKFRTLFEKIYPGFFLRLKNNAPDITVAEQRMAALTRLHLTPKQMAAMLGISVDSVHKARQRLRQRLNISAELNLEQTITSF